jgi:hypothetical protein
VTAATRTATQVVCPLAVCPAPSRTVGRIEQCPDATSGRDWLATSTHQPGHVQRCDGPYRAAVHVLTVHVLDGHGAAGGDMAVWAQVADTAHAAKRAVLGLPPIVEPAVGECSWCQQRVVRTATGRWLDPWGGDVCEGTVTLCDNLCQRSHAAGSLPGAVCGLCGSGGLVFGPHEPILGAMSRWS